MVNCLHWLSVLCVGVIIADAGSTYSPSYKSHSGRTQILQVLNSGRLLSAWSYWLSALSERATFLGGRAGGAHPLPAKVARGSGRFRRTGGFCFSSAGGISRKAAFTSGSPPG